MLRMYISSLERGPHPLPPFNDNVFRIATNLLTSPDLSRCTAVRNVAGCLQ